MSSIMDEDGTIHFERQLLEDNKSLRAALAAAQTKLKNMEDLWGFELCEDGTVKAKAIGKTLKVVGSEAIQKHVAELEAALAAAEEALAWYGEKAESLANKDWHKNPSYAEAIFTEMALDAGRRARAVRERLAELMGKEKS